MVEMYLTDRQRQLLDLAKLGKTSKEIANILGLSPQTVKNHFSVIYIKLGASDRTHAVYLALKRGLISLDNQEA